MSLLSLEKYLNKTRTSSPADINPDLNGSCSGDYVELSTRVLSAIQRSVLTGESLTDLSIQLESVRKDLHADSTRGAVAKSAARVEVLLETFQARVREAYENRAADFRKVLDILDESFQLLNAGTEKSRARLGQVEVSLTRAAKVDDLMILRSQLGKMLEYVRRESKQDLAANSKIENLGYQVRHAHASTSRFRVQLPGRTEALNVLHAGLSSQKAAANLQLGLFTADSLAALRVRHGDEIANSILEDLGRHQIQPLVPEGKVFCWSPTSVLMIWDHIDSSVAPGEVPNRLKSPLEHHAFVGTRVATFNIVVRSLVMQASGPIQEIGWALDRFAKGVAAC